MESQPSEQAIQEAISSSTTVPKGSGQITPGRSGGLNFDSLKSQPWQEFLDTILDILAKIPNYIGNFFSDYRQPLVTLLLIASGLVTIYITLAVLDAIDDIPLLSPVLKLVGLGYTAWFVYRYLWKAENRQELWQEFDAFKAQIVGKNSQDV
jgi:hypothetical protein